MFLLIMHGDSYLREALTSFLRTEISDSEILTVGQPNEIAELPGKSLEAIELVLINVGRESADSRHVVQVVEAVRDRLDGTPIVLLGDLADEPQFRLALDVGTNGYIPTGTPAIVLKHALPIIASGGVYAPPFVFASCSEQHVAASRSLDATEFHHEELVRPAAVGVNSVDAFTRREIEVLSLLAEGLPNKLIAYRLNLKEGTVKVHVRHIMNKLKVTSRTQAALFAQKHLSVLDT